MDDPLAALVKRQQILDLAKAWEQQALARRRAFAEARAQGLPDTVRDPHVLDSVALLLRL